jgi:hypothetical protein
MMWLGRSIATLLSPTTLHNYIYVVEYAQDQDQDQVATLRDWDPLKFLGIVGLQFVINGLE